MSQSLRRRVARRSAFGVDTLEEMDDDEVRGVAATVGVNTVGYEDAVEAAHDELEELREEIEELRRHDLNSDDLEKLRGVSSGLDALLERLGGGTGDAVNGDESGENGRPSALARAEEIERESRETTVAALLEGERREGMSDEETEELAGRVGVLASKTREEENR